MDDYSQEELRWLSWLDWAFFLGLHRFLVWSGSLPGRAARGVKCLVVSAWRYATSRECRREFWRRTDDDVFGIY